MTCFDHVFDCWRSHFLIRCLYDTPSLDEWYHCDKMLVKWEMFLFAHFAILIIILKDKNLTHQFITLFSIIIIFSSTNISKIGTAFTYLKIILEFPLILSLFNLKVVIRYMVNDWHFKLRVNNLYINKLHFMGNLLSLCCALQQNQKPNQFQVFPNHGFGNEALIEGHTIEKSTAFMLQISSQSTHAHSDQTYKDMSNHLHRKLCLQLSDFHVNGLLGCGSFGGVFSVTPKEIIGLECKNFALKCIKNRKMQDRAFRERAQIEKQILLSIKHPFIINLQLTFTSKKFTYLLLEEAKGGPSSTLISNSLAYQQRSIKFKKLGQSGVRFIAACVVLAIEHLHSNHIMHRDLKLENVLIFSDGYVKVADFGLSKIIQPDDKTATLAGSLLYSAPQIIFHRKYTKLIDLWALGVFIYELATSQTPFSSEQILNKQVFQSIAEDQEQRTWKQFQLSIQIKDLINKLLKLEPTQRIGSKSIDEIKGHIFFKQIDWQGLLSKTIESPLLKIIIDHPFEVRKVRNNDDLWR